MNQDPESGGSKAAMTGAQGGAPENPKANQQSDVRTLFIQGLYAILFLFILIAALQLYFSIQEFIRVWFSEEYIPIVNSLYFILVIVGGIYLTLSFIRSK
jgi:hypothetical protein